MYLTHFLIPVIQDQSVTVSIINIVIRFNYHSIQFFSVNGILNSMILFICQATFLITRLRL